MSVWIEAVTALVIALFIFVSSYFQITREHIPRGDVLSVRLGAALQGLLYGGVVAFVMLPLRMQLMAGDGDPMQRGFSSWFGALGIISLMRSGIIARAPLIGHPFRAYRLASLRRTVSLSQARIERLEALDRVGAPKEPSEKT